MSDPFEIMNEYIEKIFPDDVQELLGDLEPDMKREIKELFDYYVPELENAGDLIFNCDDFNILNEKF